MSCLQVLGAHAREAAAYAAQNLDRFRDDRQGAWTALRSPDR